MKNYTAKYFDIWKVVQMIPHGQVATYGQVARIAGYEGHARLAGYALHATPEEINIPWHRVINARGMISLPEEDGRYALQKSLLEEEGVEFRNEKINLKKYQWKL